MEAGDLGMIPMQLLMGPVAARRIPGGEKYYTHILRLRYG